MIASTFEIGATSENHIPHLYQHLISFPSKITLPRTRTTMTRGRLRPAASTTPSGPTRAGSATSPTRSDSAIPAATTLYRSPPPSLRPRIRRHRFHPRRPQNHRQKPHLHPRPRETMTSERPKFRERYQSRQSSPLGRVIKRSSRRTGRCPRRRRRRLERTGGLRATCLHPNCDVVDDHWIDSSFQSGDLS